MIPPGLEILFVERLRNHISEHKILTGNFSRPDDSVIIEIYLRSGLNEATITKMNAGHPTLEQLDDLRRRLNGDDPPYLHVVFMRDPQLPLILTRYFLSGGAAGVTGNMIY